MEMKFTTAILNFNCFVVLIVIDFNYEASLSQVPGVKTLFIVLISVAYLLTIDNSINFLRAIFATST
jgi:ABC-type uncharacterized transport system permease subunit